MADWAWNWRSYRFLAAFSDSFNDVPEVLKLVVELASNDALPEAAQRAPGVFSRLRLREGFCGCQKVAAQIGIRRIKTIKAMKRTYSSLLLMRLPIYDATGAA